MKRRSLGLRATSYCVPAIAIVIGVLATFKIRSNQAEFTIDTVSFSARQRPGWQHPTQEPKGFRPVNLPFFNGDGFFRITFSTDQPELKVSFHVQDCVRQVMLDGRRIFAKRGGCRNCRITSSSPQKPHCETLVLTLKPSGAGPHVLAVQTQNVKGPSRSYNIDQSVFWLEHGQNATGWRILLLFCALFLLVWGLSWYRHGRHTPFWWIWFGRLRRYRVVLFGYILIAVIRIAVSPAHLTTDVNQATHLYVENLIHKSDWSFATLDADYTAAKHNGKSYMHKPPGLYYQYVPARLFFGFTRIYASYMARIPGLLGDLIIALVLFQVVRRKTRDWFWSNLASLLYLFAPGTFLVNGYIGRVDALPVAFVLLAITHVHRRRLIVYFGLAALLKQLSILVGPWLIFQRRAGWKVIAAALVTLGAMLPFLIDDAHLTFQRLTSPQLNKGVSGLSWMSNFQFWGVKNPNGLASIITVGFAVGLAMISPFLRGDPHRVAAFVYISFLVFARNMAEHYLLWAAPFLIIYFCQSRRFLPLMVFGVLQIYGLLANDRAFILVGRIFNDMSLVLAVPLLIYFCVELPSLLKPKIALNEYRQRFRELASRPPKKT